MMASERTNYIDNLKIYNSIPKPECIEMDQEVLKLVKKFA